MTTLRMDHVGIVVDDLDADVAFFVELGLELGGEAMVEGRLAANGVAARFASRSASGSIKAPSPRHRGVP